MVDYLRLLKTWYRLISFQHKNLEDIHKYQMKRLKALLNHAYERVPMYKEYYDQHGFHPSSVLRYADVERIPTISKDVMRSYPLEKRIANNFSMRNLHKETTAGSSGMPLEIWTDKTEALIQTMKTFRFLRAWGYLPFYNTVQLWPPKELKKSFVQKLGVMRRQLVSTMDSSQVVIKNLMKARCDVLFSTRSLLEIYAFELKKQSTQINPKILVSGGEVMTEEQRAFLKESYGCEVLEVYGSMEIGNIAWGCPENPKSLHIDMETVFVNYSRFTTAVKEKENSIIVTNLENYVMPFIRYNLGDLIIAPEAEQCSCGRSLPVLGKVVGRDDDKISYKGQVYNFQFFNRYLRHYFYIKKVQVYQGVEGNVEFRIQLFSDDAEMREKCVQDIAGAFGGIFLPLIIRFLSEIPLTKAGKSKMIVKEKYGDQSESRNL
jgi:phenylacetate-CoA ligase